MSTSQSKQRKEKIDQHISATRSVVQQIRRKSLEASHLSKSAKEQLDAAKETLSSAFSRFYEGYFTLDLEARFQNLNTSVEEALFNRSPGELIGKNIWEEYPQLIGTEFYTQIRLAMEKGVTVHFVDNTFNGERWYEVRAYPGSGQIDIYLNDVTIRQQAEQRLSQSLSNLKFLSDSATQLLEITSAEKLYSFLGQNIAYLAGDALVVINRYDPDKEALIIERAECSLDDRQVLIERLGVDPVGMEIPLPEEARSLLIAGKLSQQNRVLHDLPFFQVPGSYFSSVQEFLGLGEIFTIPLSIDNDFLGLISILPLRKSHLNNVETIEAFVRQAVSALKRIQLYNQLESERARLSAVFSHLPGALIVTDTKGQVILTNQPPNQLFSPLTEPDQQEPQVYHPDGTRYKYSELPIVRSARHGESHVNLEIAIERPDGKRSYLLANTTPILDRKRKVTGAIGIYQDITQRKEAEEALRQARDELEKRVLERTQELRRTNEYLLLEIDDRKRAENALRISEERLRLVISGLPSILLAANRQGQIVFAEGHGLAALGWHSQDLVGRPVYSFLADSPEIREIIQQALVGEDRSAVVGLSAHPEASFECHTSPHLNASGQISGFLAVLFDVTERVKAEEQLRQSVSRTELLADISHKVIEAGNDMEQALQIMACNLAGQMGDGCIIRLVSEENHQLIVERACIPNSEQRAVVDPILNAQASVAENLPCWVVENGQLVHVNGHGVEAGDGSVLQAAGSYLSVLQAKTAIVAPMRLQDQTIGVLELIRFPGSQEFTFEDRLLLQSMADRAALAVANARLYQNLEKAYRKEKAIRAQLIQAEKHTALARMVASVAHELNNPIQTIQNCMFLLQEEVAGNHNAEDYLRMAVDESRRISGLVEQLRELYRPARERPPAPLDILELLENVHALLMPHLQHHQVTWELDAGKESVWVEGIADQIKQVFLNVCLNAIEAMEPKGGELRIEVLPCNSDGRVGIAFEDTGPGIPPDILPRLFDPFFTTKEKGTGLGLAICYELIKNHNGDITVESPVGNGAVFTVWLPVKI